MNIILLLVLSLPCALGFNLWSGLPCRWVRGQYDSGSGGFHRIQQHSAVGFADLPDVLHAEMRMGLGGIH